MPPKRKSKARKKTTVDGKKSDVPQDISQFVDFVDGLQVTSSPSVAISRVDEQRRSILAMADEQLLVSEGGIKLRFEKWIAVLERHALSKTAVWEEGGDLIKVTQSLIDEVNKAEQMYTGFHGSSGTESRKVTWASSSEQLSRPARVTRRSRSVELGCTPGQPINRTRRLSAGRSYPEFRTPSATRNFHFNIATVTPHPNQNGSLLPSILRKPKFGETAISLSGSPLLVSSDHVSVPSIVVPLADGRVFNVQGNTHSVREQLRDGLDHNTIVQLKEIKDFINNLVP